MVAGEAVDEARGPVDERQVVGVGEDLDEDVQPAHPMGIAAVHAAAASPTGAGVALVVAAGAALDATQSGSFTALHEAAHRGDAAMAELLLAAGADRSRRTDDEAASAGLARSAGHTRLAARLS